MNCAAIPSNLVASELFGYEKGAFTGAQVRTKGQIEHANGGTLFLDEIGDMPVELQGNLLRFLQDGQIVRVGGRETIDVDVRIVAATNVRLRRRSPKAASARTCITGSTSWPCTCPRCASAPRIFRSLPGTS